jgi:hypothetical protein
MTEQNDPGREISYRAYNKQNQDFILLQYPDLIKYHRAGGYVLQKKDESGAWVDDQEFDEPASEE